LDGKKLDRRASSIYVVDKEVNMQVFDERGRPAEESRQGSESATLKAGLFRISDRGTHGVPDGAQELAYRESDGITVRLSWRASEDEVFVHVRDERDGEEFVLNPPKHEALFAFYHPYAAARRIPELGRIAA
jgi:hypothetical protein